MPEMPLSEEELYTLIEGLMANAKKDSPRTVYTLLGMYYADWMPEDAKQIIIQFLEDRDLVGRDIVEDIGLGFKHKMEEWEKRWKRKSELSERNMKKHAEIEATDPLILKTYLENFKNIMKRQMPFATDKELYQDAFGQMIDLILAEDKKHDLEYLNKIVALARTFEPPIELEVPTPIVMEIRRKDAEKEEKEEAERVVKDKQKRREQGNLTLEEQMEEALAEERYEDAGEIKKKMDALKRSMGNFEDTLSIHKAEQDSLVVYADNLDLIQPDKPYDDKQSDQLRQRHRKRFRNEPGGSDEGFMEGLDGTKNMDRGIGSDQHSDVGSPASINLASKKDSIWKNRVERRKSMGLEPYNVDEIRNKFRKKIPAPNMPNEKMERDPSEEREVTEVWKEFNNMEER